jgi:hypothetical protein
MAEKREVDYQVAREAKAQPKLEAAKARKAATTAKKAEIAAIKAAKSARRLLVVILKVGSTL